MLNLLSYKNKFQEIETPFYFYDLDLLKATVDRAKSAIEGTNYHIHYALKANANPEILKVIKASGFGADCVSGNEVRRAIDIGFDPSEIAFAGVGKKDKEILFALDKKIFAFNCESMHEIEVINQLAGGVGAVADIALRINPNVDAQTHKNITTGLEENKFGINISELDQVIEKINGFQHIKVKGIHFHIGSQVMNLDNYRQLCFKANELVKLFRSKGMKLEHLNVGGGLGIDYEQPLQNPIPPFEEYFGVFKKNLELQDPLEIHFELGRSITGQCGALITRVLYVKYGIKRNFLIVDAGMTELMRPALYQAKHKIFTFSDTDTREVYDVVGPICESTDFFEKGVELPKSERGDLIALLSSGAYGQVMANQYNMRDQIQAVYSSNL